MTATALAAWLFAAAGAPAAAPPVEVISRTHPAIFCDFEQTAAPWAPKPIEDEPPTVEHRLVAVEGRGRVLEIRNLVPGGFVASQVVRARRDAAFLSHIAFDYQADPQLKVNLLARVDYVNYEFGLTGLPCDTGNTVYLGTPGEPRADGQWHRYELPLLSYIRQKKPGRATLRLSALTVENQHQGDYLLAGFGGNPVGATLRIDNFEFYRPGPAEGTFDFNVPRGSEVEGFAYVFDQRPDTEPPATLSTTEKTVTKTDLTEGVWFLHVRARSGGEWGPVNHYRFHVDTSPPTLGAIAPAPGAAGCPAAWSCQLTDAGVGVAPQSVLVAVTEGEPKFRDELADPNAADTVEELDAQNSALEYNPVSGQLQVHLGRLKKRFADGATVGVAVKAADENGVAMPVARSTFKLRYADDATAPQHPRLLLRLPGDTTAQPLPGDGSFEYGLDEWTAYDDHGVVLERTDETAASGRYSLRLRCTENASYFGVVARQSKFDAGRFRTLSFDYKVPDRLRVDLMVKCNEQFVGIRFTDRDVDELVITEGVPAVIADNQWHHLELPLYELLRKRFPGRPSYQVEMIMFSGGAFGGPSRRYPGNYAGTEYFIDNFLLVPTLGADTRLEWQADDTVGVTGAQIVAATTPESLPGADATDVGRTVEGNGVALDTLEQGLVYLWARLRDARGNLAAPVVTRFLVDAGKPLVGAVWPADGSRVAPDDLGLELRDERGAGLDLGSIVLEVAGRPFTIDGTILRYDAPAGKLVWDARLARDKLALQNGQQVTVRLAEARDHAGNRPDRMPAWSFTVDYAQDQIGPTVTVSSTTHASHVQETFDLAPVLAPRAEPEGSATLELVDDGHGGRALRVARAQPGQPYTAWLTLPTPGTTIRFAYLRFDYRIAAGTEVDLLLAGIDRDDQWQPRVVTMLDGSPAGQPIGRIEGVVADGQWHTAVVAANELLSAGGLPSPRRLAAIGFGDTGAAGRGQGLEIDNIALLRQPPATDVKLKWEALDISGVAGYSFVMDQNPGTVPPPTVATTELTTDVKDVPPGTSYFHIRAVDGAGNWGPVSHYMVMIRPR